MALIIRGDRPERSLTRRHGLKLALTALGARCLSAYDSTDSTRLPDVIQNIPRRSPGALTGSQFADTVSGLDRRQREQAILEQILGGNLPDFLRKLIPVRLNNEQAGGKRLAATIYVMPEYLAIGSDHDFLRIPMNFHTAKTVAERFGFILPTRKIVDAIYDQCTCRFFPQPMPAGPQMRSTEYYRIHNAMIQRQTGGFPPGALVAGHKKDVVVSNRLRLRPDRIAIYGWHRLNGWPIQPLSTIHGADYADYSHGIRLVSGETLMEGKLQSSREILDDSEMSTILSDEGAISVSSVFGNV